MAGFCSDLRGVQLQLGNCDSVVVSEDGSYEYNDAKGYVRTHSTQTLFRISDEEKQALSHSLIRLREAITGIIASDCDFVTDSSKFFLRSPVFKIDIDAFDMAHRNAVSGKLIAEFGKCVRKMLGNRDLLTGLLEVRLDQLIVLGGDCQHGHPAN